MCSGKMVLIARIKFMRTLRLFVQVSNHFNNLISHHMTGKGEEKENDRNKRSSSLYLRELILNKYSVNKLFVMCRHDRVFLRCAYINLAPLLLLFQRSYFGSIRFFVSIFHRSYFKFGATSCSHEIRNCNDDLLYWEAHKTENETHYPCP